MYNGEHNYGIQKRLWWIVDWNVVYRLTWTFSIYVARTILPYQINFWILSVKNTKMYDFQQTSSILLGLNRFVAWKFQIAPTYKKSLLVHAYQNLTIFPQIFREKYTVNPSSVESIMKVLFPPNVSPVFFCIILFQSCFPCNLLFYFLGRDDKYRQEFEWKPNLILNTMDNFTWSNLFTGDFTEKLLNILRSRQNTKKKMAGLRFYAQLLTLIMIPYQITIVMLYQLQ